MSLQFSGIVENKRHLGFDSIRPKEIFCRKGGSRALKVPPNDPGIYEFKSSNPHVATAESVVNPPPGEWHVEIKGKARGTAIITSHRDGQQEDEVTVYVYPDRVVKVNFYRCYDTIAREAPYFTHSDVPDALARINALYKYQAGIVFESHLLKTPIVDPQVDLRTPNQTEEQYRKVFAYMKLVCDQFDTSSSHRNIFLVRKWSAKDRPGEAAESAMRDVFGTT
ncbi:MAG TPA: hypothetical protein VHM91_07790, partial [Verrucomicrobiales bacterium]|nr:hypothetical protein [Verrucomicrobiales bacterium]